MIVLALIELATAAAVPLTGSAVLVRIFAVLLLIAINAFFVMAEFSIVSVRQSRISQLAAAGDIPARTVQHLQQGIDRLLSTTQLGITLSSLALGWIGESTMAVVLATWLAQLPLPAEISRMLAHSIAVPIAFVSIAYLQIVLGELCPKSVALLYPEQLARWIAQPSWAIARLFNPFIWVLNQSTRWLLRLVGIQYNGQGWYNRVTPEELQLIINNSTESPGLEAEERELLNNVLEFAEVSASEVMVPRTNIAAISGDATFEMLLHEVAESGYSRYPVMGESLDDISGIIYFKELAEPLAQRMLNLDSPISPWVRSAHFVPEYVPLNELLHLMQQSAQEMMIVVDEFGGTAGLITIKDLVGEIIGHTREPEDLEEPAVQSLDPQTFLVQAQIDIEAVNDLLALNLPIDEVYQTLGGFVIHQLQKIPVPGEQLRYQDLELTVISAEGPRLHQIQIYRLLASAQPSAGESLSAESTAELVSDLQAAPPQTPDDPNPHASVSAQPDRQ